jgi:hypothetical protein
LALDMFLGQPRIYGAYFSRAGYAPAAGSADGRNLNPGAAPITYTRATSIAHPPTNMAAQQPSIVAPGVLLAQQLAPAVHQAAGAAAPPPVDAAQQLQLQQANAELAAARQAEMMIAARAAAASVQSTAAADAAQPGASKVQMIADATAANVVGALLPHFNALTLGIATMQTEVAALKAVQALSGGTRATTRGRTTASSSGGSSSKGEVVIDPSRVKNKRLFFRMKYIQDPDVRKEWSGYRQGMKVGSADFDALMTSEKFMGKKGSQLLSAQALELWSVMNEDMCNTWGTLFRAWTSQSSAASTPAPLAADGGLPQPASIVGAATAADVSQLLDNEHPF